MILRVSLLLLAFNLADSHPVPFTIEKDGRNYPLNQGSCDYISCGQMEGRGTCINHIYTVKGLHRQSYYCQCNMPFTGAYCDDTVRVDTIPLSYKECPQPLHCMAVYGDEKCDKECNSSECLYDGYDCLVQPFCPEECKNLSSNGVCDDLCNSEECEFDSGDCLSEKDVLPGQILLRLSITAQDFIDVSRNFLFQLSYFLRTTVVLSKDANGPLIWEFSSDEGTGSRIPKGQNSSMGIEVAFSMSLINCASECLHSVADAVGIVAQSLASESLPISAAHIISVSSTQRSSSSSVNPFIAITTLILVGVIIIIGSIQLSRPRKRVLEAPEWMPPVHGEIPMSARPLKKARVAPPTPTRLHLVAAGIDPFSIEDEEDVNARNELGRTPVMMAIRSERLETDLRETVDRLLQAGADLRAVDEGGWGALHHSFHKLRSPNFNRWLISQGANSLVVDMKGRSLIHLATEYNDLPNLQLLLAETGAGADKVLPINLADCSNRTALSIAVSTCTLPFTRLLLDNGADVNCNGEERFDSSLPRKFPLHLAVEFKRKEHLLLLINRGCRMDSRDNRGRSALHYAVLYADLAICRILVDAGTQVDAEDDEDRSAEEIARENRLTEIEEYLITVRGKNEPWKRKRDRKPKRYSTDQGYGSEESRHQPSEDMNSPQQDDSLSTPSSSLPLHSLPTDFSALAQTAAVTGHTQFTPMSTSISSSFQSELTSSGHPLYGSASSLMYTSPFVPQSFPTPL